MEELVPIIIVVVILLVKGMGKLMKDSADKGTAGDAWDDDGDWTPAPGSTPGSQTAKPQTQTPSPRVQQILEQLKNQVKEQVAPTPSPVVPAPDRSATRPAVSPTVSRPLQHRKYLQAAEPPPAEPAAEPPPAPAPVQKTKGELFRENAGKAFPGGMRKISQPATGRRIGVYAKGKTSLRKGILLSEVFGAPRAFDL